MAWPTANSSPSMSTKPAQGSTAADSGWTASTGGGGGGTWGHDTHADFPGSTPGPSEHDYLFNDRRSEGRRHAPT